MIIPLRCVGIDVSKQYLDVCDEAVGASERIANALDRALDEDD